MKKPLHRLGALQIKILQVLWVHTEASVAQVLEDLNHGKKFAYTTVATMLRKMEVKDLVGHREDNRSYIYHAKVSEAEVSGHLAEDVMDRLFQGNLTQMVNHLLSRREITRDELSQLETLINNKKKTL